MVEIDTRQMNEIDTSQCAQTRIDRWETEGMQRTGRCKTQEHQPTSITPLLTYHTHEQIPLVNRCSASVLQFVQRLCCSLYILIRYAWIQMDCSIDDDTHDDTT